MFDCHADASEAVVVHALGADGESACSPTDRVASSPSDEYFGWGEYALFVLGQQGGYCQLV
jgi:hypothetical protein